MTAPITRHASLPAALCLVAGCLLMSGCEPSDRRPGLWLSGELQSQLPADWSFTDAHPEIFVEVAAPYGLPHSVTIWCAQVDGTLYLGARAPESKRWPGWVDDDPDVRIEIDDRIYPVRLEPLTAAAEVEQVAAAYAAKYDLPGGLAGTGGVSQRYWRVVPRL
ncbi:MAG: hypothetical protein RIB46_02010 [Pseudomonadales bacterium]